MANKRLTVTLTKSPIGRLKKHKGCLVGLGLRRIGQSTVLEDSDSVRGMIKKVDYMVRLEDEADATK
jgi:large subunit ribosomal protein L30